MPVDTGAHALFDSRTGANIDVIRMAVFLKDEAVDTPLRLSWVSFVRRFFWHTTDIAHRTRSGRYIRQVSEGVCTTLNRGYAITHYGKLASAPLPTKHADTIRALMMAIEAAFH